MTRRIVITGVGAVTPVGIGADAFWNGLAEGKPGIEAISLFDASEFSSRQAAEVKGFDAKQLLARKGLQYLNRSIQLGCAAAKLGLEDSGIEVTPENRSRIGVVYGTTLGCLNMLAQFDQQSLIEGPRLANPMIFPNTGVSAPACQVSIMFGMDAFNTTLSNGQTSSLDAIKYAFDFIRLGRADIVLAGGVEEVCREIFLGHYLARLLSGSRDQDQEISAPFDRRHNGVILGEGSAVLVLEEYEHARSRGARVLAEVRGYGTAFDPLTANGYDAEATGATAAMQAAMDDAGIGAPEIDLIFANANSNLACDRMEATAIERVFGSGIVPAVTAIKSMVGEAYSAAGALQVAAAALAIDRKIVPPTINFTEPDPGCPVKTIATVPQEKELRAVLVNSFGCSGGNAAVVLTRPSELNGGE